MINANKKANATNEQAIEWATMLVADSKLVGIYNKKDTGKTSFIFEVASEKGYTFIVSAKLVRRNKDHNGWEVSLPKGQEVQITKSTYNEKTKKYEHETATADDVTDLGYPLKENIIEE